MTINRESVSRRDALRMSLATASLLVVAGCQSSRSSADFDAASKDLRGMLDGMATGELDEARLASISRRLEVKARELIDDYQEFKSNLDTLTVNRDVSSDGLGEMASRYQARRIALRNDLYRLQDELRGELSAAEWEEVATALNRKAESIARQKSRG